MLKFLCAILFVGMISTKLFAQFEYEASEKNPFGSVNPEAPEQVKDFAPLIGECDCKSTTRNASDGSWNETTDMYWKFKYIMNGFAVQDESLGSNGKHSGSIRQFLPDEGKWVVHYYTNASVPKVLPAWEGEKKEGKIILYREQTAPNGMEGFYKITFSNMTEKGFNWTGEWVNPDESIIYPTFKIECQKRK